MYVGENTALRRAHIIIANFINSDRINDTEGTARTVDERKITAVHDTISDHARSLRTGH